MTNLTPTEQERLLIFTTAELARRYRSLGVKLSQPEAVALITDEILTAARLDKPFAEVAEAGCSLLTTDDVLPGVAEMVPIIYVDCLFAEGRHLVTVYDPIRPGEAPVEPVATAGEIIPADGEIELNAGRARVSLEVMNSGDRPIQVRSHAHFFEVNKALAFDRTQAYGMRLDRPSGGGVRFDPGVLTKVDLVPFAGDRRLFGFNDLVNGDLDAPGRRAAALEKARRGGFIDSPEAG